MSLLIKVPALDVAAIKAKTDNLPADPASETGNIAAVKAKTDALPLDPASDTNVAAVGATATAIQGKTDNLPADPASETGAIVRKYPFMDFWSAPVNKLTISSVAADIAFPSMVVAGLPGGFTLKRAVLILTCRAIKDTSGADNKVNGANKTLRIKKSTGAWGVDDAVGIAFDQNSLYCASSTKEAGPTIIGPTDVKGTVNDNATYNVMTNQTNRGDAVVSLGNNLELYDVQVGLRIWFE